MREMVRSHHRKWLDIESNESNNVENGSFSLLKMGRNQGYQSEAQEKTFGKRGGL